MKKNLSEYLYNQEDIEKAFDMGLETAIAVFENTTGLSPPKQNLILNKLREDRKNIRDILGIGK